MATDRDMAQLCVASYEASSSWDRLWAQDIYAGLKGNVLCFRGSDTINDWFHDLDAETYDDVLLGELHAGFADHMWQFFQGIQTLLNENMILCGHSLGAARALIFGGYMEQIGTTPKAIITFGSPRPGFARLKEVLSVVTIRSYRNGLDPVPELPREIEPWFGYQHPRALINIGTIEEDDIDVASYHYSQNYANNTPATEII